MRVRFEKVALRALGIALPENEISSLEIERRLGPAYGRLGLVPGRLELMTGIRARRHFPEGTLPSAIAAQAAEDLFSRAVWAREAVDCLIHASVCRDYVEPATAAAVHDRLHLSPSCLVFDLSNACLSWMSALVIGAGLIESGQARSVLVVSGEDARALVETTIHALNTDATLTRSTLKPSFASLTLGSGGAAALLTGFDGAGARLKGGAFLSATRFHPLCRGGGAAQNTTSAITMETDSETMLREGVALAAETWKETREALGLRPSDFGAYITHQVGKAHLKLMQERLELDPRKDFSTFEMLGNMGASAVGVTLALGARSGKLRDGEVVALLGIGSGLVCGMLGLEWSDEVTR